MDCLLFWGLIVVFVQPVLIMLIRLFCVMALLGVVSWRLKGF